MDIGGNLYLFLKHLRAQKKSIKKSGKALNNPVEDMYQKYKIEKSLLRVSRDDICKRKIQ